MIVVRLLVAALAAAAALLLPRGAVVPAAPVPAGAAGSGAGSGSGSGSGSPAPSAPPVPRGMRIARILLVAAGALLTGIAFGLIAAGVPSGQWLGIAVWLAGALVLHDGVLAAVLLVAMRVLRRTSAVLPWRTIAVVEVVLVAAGALTLLAFPALRAQALGARNPSVLPFDYGLHLAVAWAVAGVLIVAAVVAGVLARSRAQQSVL